MYGDDNLCPRCHNTTGVRAVDGGYRCLACGGPRERKPGTVVVGEDVALRGAADLARRGGSIALRLFGVSLIGAGILASAAVFALVGGAGGAAVAVATGLVAAGAGALALRGASRASESSASRERTERELAILELAATRGGTLAVTDVATALGVGLADAEAALDGMADGSRVTAEVTTDGRIEYVFREIVARQGPRVRVEVPEGPSAAAELEVLAKDAAEREREPR